MSAQQTRIRLIVLVAAALAGAVVVSLFQRNQSYFFEVALTSSRAETAKVSYDTGQGLITGGPYQHHAGSPVYRFALPTGMYDSLYFIPLSDEGSATFHDAKIVDRKGRLIRSFEPRQFQPLDQIAHFSTTEETATVQTSPHATKPRLQVLTEGPFRLEKLDFDPVHNIIRAFPSFLILFLGGLAAGVVPAIRTWWQGVFRAPGPQNVTPDAVPETAQQGRWAALLTWSSRHRVCLTVFAAAAILLARLPDRFFNPQFWAEDGYFFTWALREGWRSLFAPYGGYQLLIPRIAELVATTLPLAQVPLFLNLTALAIALIVISRVLSERSQLKYAPLLALIIVLVPRPEDIFLSIENVQWIMALGFILLLISSEASSTKQRLYDYIATVMFGLTGVFAILFLPFFGLRALQRRTLHSTVLACLVTATALIQVWFVAHNPPLYAEHASRFKYLLVPTVAGYQLFQRLFGGEWLPQLTTILLIIAGFLMTAYCGFIYTGREKTESECQVRRILILVMTAALAASI